MIKKTFSILMISTTLVLSFINALTVVGNASGYPIKLPLTPVTMVVYNGTDSYFRTLLSNVPLGYDVTDGEYLGWCADRRYIIPRGGVTHEVTLYCSCNPADLPEDIKDKEWDKVNYIINHKNGTMMDIQEAIWYFINMVDGYSPSTLEAWSMVNDALENGTGFVPRSGNVLAIICYPKEVTQRTFIELYLPKPPVASFTYEPTWPQACETVTFNASESIPNEGSIVSYMWDFGDGNITATGDPIITHHYTTHGNYNVSLTITNSAGLSDSTEHVINVRGHPHASFTYLPTDPGTGESITFDASASTPDGGTLNNFRWNFDDGNVTDTASQTITHRFTSHGIYNVTLTVFDSENKNDTTWRLVTVITHDISVVAVNPESSWLYKFKLCHANINVTVTNKGDTAETFTLTLYADNDTTTIGDEYTIGDQTVTDLLPDEYRNLTFTWDTTDVQACRFYVITANASIVPHEINIEDNVMSSAISVKVRIPSDINGDGAVDMIDLWLAAKAFGTKPEDPRWDPAADVNNDYIIDMVDIYTVAINFGNTCEHWRPPNPDP